LPDAQVPGWKTQCDELGFSAQEYDRILKRIRTTRCAATLYPLIGFDDRMPIRLRKYAPYWTLPAVCDDGRPPTSSHRSCALAGTAARRPRTSPALDTATPVDLEL